jgi:DNA-binding GntR family transcriptional regulator
LEKILYSPGVVNSAGEDPFMSSRLDPSPEQPELSSTRLSRVNYADQVADKLREDILAGSLMPRERLRMQSLTERFGVSQIPIREALRALEAEGLVVSTAGRALHVSDVRVDDLASLYSLRRMLECPLSRQSMLLASDDDIAAVVALLNDLEGVDRATPRFWGIHRDFHRALLKPALNVWSARILEQLWRSSERYVRIYMQFASFDNAMVEHRAMAAAATTRDGELLEAHTSRHLMSVERSIREAYFRQIDEADPADLYDEVTAPDQV